MKFQWNFWKDNRRNSKVICAKIPEEILRILKESLRRNLNISGKISEIILWCISNWISWRRGFLEEICKEIFGQILKKIQEENLEDSNQYSWMEFFLKIFSEKYPKKLLVKFVWESFDICLEDFLVKSFAESLEKYLQKNN